MIKEVTEAKALLSEGYALKVAAGGRWLLSRDKSKPQRVHKNVIRVLRNEAKASFAAPEKIEPGPLFSIPRNKKRGTPTSSAKGAIEFLLANGVQYAKKEYSQYVDYFSIRVSKADEKIASRLLFGSSTAEWERWAKAQDKKAARKRAAKKRAATKPKTRRK